MTMATGRTQFRFKADSLLMRQRTQEIHRFAGHTLKIACRMNHHVVAGFQPCQRQQRFRQTAHALGRPLAGTECLTVLVIGTFAGKSVLRVREHHGDRCAQLVRGIRREPSLPRERRIKPREGRVEHPD